MGRLDFGSDEKVILFPLTSMAVPLLDLREELEGSVETIEILESSRAISEAAQNLKGKYIKFVADLPDRIRAGKKNLIEYFRIDGFASLWWLSLIAEKNTFKPDSITRMVQYDAIMRCIRERGIDRVILACSSGKLMSAFKTRARSRPYSLHLLPVRSPLGLKERSLDFQGLFYLRHLIRLSVYLFQLLSRLLR